MRHKKATQFSARLLLAVVLVIASFLVNQYPRLSTSGLPALAVMSLGAGH